MIIPAGVLVPAELARVVVDELVRGIRVGRVAPSGEVLRLVAELEHLSANPSVVTVNGRGRLPGRADAVSVLEMAATLGISPRSVRRRAAAGTIHATKQGGRWWLEC